MCFSCKKQPTNSNTSVMALPVEGKSLYFQSGHGLMGF
uniref:Uncharacterized protein n=1 Tax=Rhizophora mucronata TaxID=61149 RepID=A0A2P2JFR5_RHIMU